MMMTMIMMMMMMMMVMMMMTTMMVMVILFDVIGGQMNEKYDTTHIFYLITPSFQSHI